MTDAAAAETSATLILASASPRRHELLTRLVAEFRVVPADIDEAPGAAEMPSEYVRRMAREKAGHVAAGHPGWVLGADTAVVLDDRALGKPDSVEAARDMLEALSGREHRVLSAVALLRGTAVYQVLSETRVRFSELPGPWIETVIESGEPMDKAGAYAIQGRAGIWVEYLAGSYSGVVGLPLYETGSLLRRAGLLPY